MSTVDANNEMALRGALSSRRRWVVKIGSSLLTADGRGIDRENALRFLPRYRGA